MKAIQTVPQPDLHRAEAEVSAQIKALFDRCRDLSGFVIREEAAPQNDEHAAEEPCLLVTEVGLSAAVTVEEVDKVYHLINRAISDVLLERPEAFELLRGRTFARALH